MNFRHHLDKVFLAIAIAYLASVLLWLLGRHKLEESVTAQPQESSSQPSGQGAPGDAEFMEYMRRSLEQMEEKSSASPAAVALKMPTVPSPPPPVAANPPTIVERIYVPIYPPSQPATSNPPAIPSQAYAPPPPAPAAEPSSVPVLTPGAKLLPSPAGNALVGLLESGERSYALFKVNGMTQRFEVGEPIGGSGWILAGVKNQRAFLSRNGQQRTVEVGQSF